MRVDSANIRNGKSGANHRVPSLDAYWDVLDHVFEHYVRSGIDLKEFLGQMEKHILLLALFFYDGNQRRASECLAMKPTTLNAKCKKYQIIFEKTARDLLSALE